MPIAPPDAADRPAPEHVVFLETRDRSGATVAATPLRGVARRRLGPHTEKYTAEFTQMFPDERRHVVIDVDPPTAVWQSWTAIGVGAVLLVAGAAWAIRIARRGQRAWRLRRTSGRVTLFSSASLTFVARSWASDDVCPHCPQVARSSSTVIRVEKRAAHIRPASISRSRSPPLCRRTCQATKPPIPPMVALPEVV